MELTLGNGFCELSQDEMDFVDGGIATAVAVALLALGGVGFTAGVTMGIKLWF